MGILRQLDELKFSVGQLEVDPSRITINGIHRLVVTHRDELLELFAAPTPSKRHSDVVRHFTLPEKTIVGGALMVLDQKLFLTGSSGEFNALPPPVLDRFASLLLPMMQERGIPAAEAKVLPDATITNLNHFWYDFDVGRSLRF